MKDIPGYPNYAVTEYGQVWSNQSGKFLRQSIAQCGGYPFVNIRGPKGGRPVNVHVLVLLAYDGPCPKGMECRHLDGNPENNTVTNLCWGARLENARDRVRHGTANGPKGILHPKAKLAERDVRLIIYQMKTGLFTQRELGKIYNIDHSIINDIVHRKIWKHIWN